MSALNCFFFCSFPPVFKWLISTANINVLFHWTGVSGKEGAIQLTSKALKKSTDRNFHYKGNAILETAPEMDEQQQVKTDELVFTETNGQHE